MGAGSGSPPYVRARIAGLVATGGILLVAAVTAAPSAAVLEPLGTTTEGLALTRAPATAAAIRRGTDREARVRFTLNGRLLTVRLLRRAPRRTRRAVYGKRIRAVCGTNFNFTRGVKVRRTRFWPRGQRRLRYRFRRNISRRARWCLIEHPAGGDVAFASLAS
jgi:hypothetical protein